MGQAGDLVQRTASLIVVLALFACTPAAGGSNPGGVPRGATLTQDSSAVPPGGTASAASSPAVQALVEAARQEGQLTFVWGAGTMGGADGVRRLAEGFNRHYGLNLAVNFTPGPSMPEVASRIGQEYQAGRPASTDLVVGYAVHMAALLAQDALEPVEWLAWASNVRRPEQMAPQGTAVAFETSTPGITYNSARLRSDEVPKTLQDLLQPRYKGRVASTPYAANFDYLATDELWGEQRTMDFLARFRDQIAGLIRCNETERLASGQFDVLALDCGQSNALGSKAQGAPIGFALVADVPLLIPLYVAVPRNARHPNAAKLWVDYLLSREAQDILYQEDWADSHLVPGSKTAKEIDAVVAGGVKLVTADVEFVRRQDETEYSRRRARAQELLRRQ